MYLAVYYQARCGLWKYRIYRDVYMAPIVKDEKQFRLEIIDRLNTQGYRVLIIKKVDSLEDVPYEDLT